MPSLYFNSATPGTYIGSYHTSATKRFCENS